MPRTLKYGRGMLVLMLVKNGDKPKAYIVGRAGKPHTGIGSKEQHSAYTAAKLFDGVVQRDGGYLTSEEVEAVQDLFPYTLPSLEMKKISISTDRMVEFAKNSLFFSSDNHADDKISAMYSDPMNKLRYIAFVIVPFPSIEEV